MLTLDTLPESKSHLFVVQGDFNFKTKNWYINDKTTTEGAKMEFLASQYRPSQMINEPTHVLENSSSCIDLSFTSKPNFVLDSGIHPSLQQNCHLQIVYVKFNLKFVFPHLMNKQCGIEDKGTPNLIEEQFVNLIGREI